MSAPAAPARRSRRRLAPVVIGLGLAAFVALAGWQSWVHLGAWNRLKEGRDALARDDPAAARPPLDRCLETWPDHAEAHFLAGRAARKCGDLEAAGRHLDAAARAGHPAAEVRFEQALLKARTGRLGEAADDLYRALGEGHPRAAEALEILVPWCMADFRIPEAGELTARWVEADPASVPAWTFRAEILERLGKKQEAVEALRKLVGLDPVNRRSRLSLARVILETRGEPGEAAGHLEWLTSTDPADTAALVQLGACREAQGRPDEAAAVLDRVLAGTVDAVALYYRGRVELNRGRPEVALPFLRRAADLDPSRVEFLYTLFVCTQRTGSADEVKAAEERWRRCEADRKRVGELARAIGASPYDPDLRCEMGELFLRNGQAAQGVRWLESALRIRPNHAPTHSLLAGYYQRIGRPELAREHTGFDPR